MIILHYFDLVDIYIRIKCCNNKEYYDKNYLFILNEVTIIYVLSIKN